MPPEWITGTLTDFEDHIIRIDDVPHPAYDSAMKICRSLLSKKSKVDYKLTDKGEICDIRPFKPNGSQPSQPAAQPSAAKQDPPKGNSTSPRAPPADANKPKNVEGQITAIDHGTHKISVKDKTGQVHEFVWSGNVKMTNNKGEPLKQWWFIKVTGEPAGDLWKLTAHAYFKRPDDWPLGNKGGNGGGGGQPRNEKAILFQCLFKGAVEIRKQQLAMNAGMSPLADVLKECVTAAKEALPEALTASGVTAP